MDSRRLNITFQQLKKYFIDKNMTAEKCAEKLGCSISTIYRRLGIFGLCAGVKNNRHKKSNKRRNARLKPVAGTGHAIKTNAHTNTERYISDKLKNNDKTNKKITRISTKYAEKIIKKARQIRSTLQELMQEVAALNKKKGRRQAQK